MMYNPPEHSQSGYPYSEHFEKLSQVRRALLAVLVKHKEEEKRSPVFTLFCSKKTYREDELHQGLTATRDFACSPNRWRFSEN